MAHTLWHARPHEDIAEEFSVAPAQGLVSSDAAIRLAAHGPNRLAEARMVPRWSLLARQFEDVLIWVLIGAAAVSGFLLSEWIHAAAIGVIVILNAVLGFAQESRAENALTALEELTARAALVRRNGRPETIPAHEIVPGDVLILEPGVKVAADGRLAEAVHLRVDESLLTGESVPVVKERDDVNPQDAGVADRSTMVHAGTTIVAGRGSAITVATGQQTEMGKIAVLIPDENPATSPHLRTTPGGRRLLVIGLGAALILTQWLSYAVTRWGG